MSANLTLAKPDHFDRLDILVAACHAEMDVSMSAEARALSISPLLEGSPHGAIYLIGPPRAPIGYVVISFGWSLEFGGMIGEMDELYVRPGVRGRGMAGEVLHSLPRALSAAGLKALNMTLNQRDDEAQTLYSRSGFALRDNARVMTRRL